MQRFHALQTDKAGLWRRFRLVTLVAFVAVIAIEGHGQTLTDRHAVLVRSPAQGAGLPLFPTNTVRFWHARYEYRDAEYRVFVVEPDEFAKLRGVWVETPCDSISLEEAVTRAGRVVRTASAIVDGAAFLMVGMPDPVRVQGQDRGEEPETTAGDDEAAVAEQGTAEDAAAAEENTAAEPLNICAFCALFASVSDFLTEASSRSEQPGPPLVFPAFLEIGP